MSNPEGSGPRRYAKPYVQPQSLDLLTGPVTGVVRLPRQLAWSGSAVYDLVLSASRGDDVAVGLRRSA